MFQLQKDLASIAQGSSDISTYYTRIKRIWDELCNLSTLPACTCATVDAWKKIDQDQRLIQFLMGMNEDYRIIRGNLLMMQPLPSVSQAYVVLFLEEKQREVKASIQFRGESASFNANFA